MGRGNFNQRLNGLNPLAYIGDNSYQPPEFVTDHRAPTSKDSKNFELGTLWLNTTNNPPTANDVWMLVSLFAGVATWVNFVSGTLMTLTSNSGGAVSPTAGNINVVGDGTTIVGVGDPGTSTITFSVSGTGVVSSLTGNSGGAVFPTAGNIDVLGTGVITVVGNPGTSTLTITPSGDIASSFPTDSGTAIPSAGALTIHGSGGITTSGSGSTVTITGSGGTVTTLHTDDGNDVTATAGVINLAGTHGLNTTGTVGPNTATVALNNTITLGDLSSVALSDAITLTSGNITLSGSTASSATNPMIIFGTAGNHISFFLNSVFMGQNAGNTSGSGLFNVGIGPFCLTAVTTGERNMAVGNGSMAATTTGSKNVGMGYTTLIKLTTGSRNTQVGATDSVAGITTGNDNTLIGFSAGGNYTGAESGNIIIGSNMLGVVGENNVTKIGGIRGATTTNADAVAVLIDSAGQLGTVSSSIRYKENVHDMACYSEDIYKLRPVTFNYKEHGPQSKTVGLIAEEVDKFMPQLIVYKDGQPETVKYHELVPMLLNEIQKLHKRIEILENQ